MSHPSHPVAVRAHPSPHLFFLAGVGRTAAVVALFVLGGVGAAVLAGAPLTPAPYPLTSMGEAGDDGEPQVWLVDGFNTLHVALLGGESRAGWWRGAARERLRERVRHFDARGAELWVVFDGAHPGDAEAAGPPHIVFAPSADAWLLRRIAHAPDPSALAVVTADRSLAERARRRGARVVTPGAFLARCGTPDPAGGGTAI